jgi:phage gp16-like protein
MMKMIEPIQVQLIHIAKTQLGLSREEYEAAIMGQTKGQKISSKDLTYFEADGLINYFKTLGFRIQSNYIRTSGAARRARWSYANAASVPGRIPGTWS